MEDKYPIVAVLSQHGVRPSTPDAEIYLEHLTQVFQGAQDAVDWFDGEISSLGVVLALEYSYKVVEALLTASADASRHCPEECFAAAASLGLVEAMERLHRSGFVDINGHWGWEDDTLLTNAIMIKSDVGVRCILRLGANPNLLNRGGCTPLYEAAYYPCLPILQALLDAGADPAITNTNGIYQHLPVDSRTPLHAAATSNFPEGIEMLVEAGADVNRPDYRGDTPLHEAAKKRHFLAVNALLAAGADPVALNNKGETPMMLIAQKFSENPENLQFEGAIAAALVAAGAYQWDYVPFGCPYLQCALSGVWNDAPDELPQLFKRLEPQWQGTVRAALLPMHRYDMPTELRAKILSMVAGDVSEIELTGNI